MESTRFLTWKIIPTSDGAASADRKLIPRSRKPTTREIFFTADSFRGTVPCSSGKCSRNPGQVLLDIPSSRHENNHTSNDMHTSDYLLHNAADERPAIITTAGP